MELPNSARELLEAPELAHLTTLNPDGGPQVSAVWVGLDGDDIVMGHAGAWQKVKNVGRDPRVALAVVSPNFTKAGAQQSLVIYGEATVTSGGAYELLSRLAHSYLDKGPDSYERSATWLASKFPAGPDPGAGYVVRVSPTRVSGYGPWNTGPNVKHHTSAI